MASSSRNGLSHAPNCSLAWRPHYPGGTLDPLPPDPSELCTERGGQHKNCATKLHSNLTHCNRSSCFCRCIASAWIWALPVAKGTHNQDPVFYGTRTRCANIFLLARNDIHNFYLLSLCILRSFILITQRISPYFAIRFSCFCHSTVPRFVYLMRFLADIFAIWWQAAWKVVDRRRFCIAWESKHVGEKVER